MNKKEKRLLILLLAIIVIIVVACGGIHNEKPDADEAKYHEETITTEHSSDAVVTTKETEELYTNTVSEVEEHVDSNINELDTDNVSGEYYRPDEEVIYEQLAVISDTDSNNNYIDDSDEVDDGRDDGRDIEDTDADGSYADADIWRDDGTTGDNNNQGLTEEEIWQIARITWLETGVCSYYTRYLTACVLLNRLYDWPECNSIYDVIYEPGQYATAYQYTDWGGNALVISDTTWAAVYDAIENTDRNPHFQCSYAPGYELYYYDADYNVYFYY